MRSFGRRKRNSSSRRWKSSFYLGVYPCRREACREVTRSSIGGGGILLRCAGSFEAPAGAISRIGTECLMLLI